MYRDFVEEPVRIEVNGTTWWYQKFNGWDGKLKSVVLYDAEGWHVCDFPSFEELEDFVSKAVMA